MSVRRALITGASAGLGAEFARQLAATGRSLVLVARRTELMESLAAELRDDHGIEVDILQADLADAGTPRALYDEILARDLQVDYLINNAGAHGPDLLLNRDWDAQRRYVELMMTSVAAMCHLFIPAMQQRGEGRVINVASVAGLISFAGDYSYGPTKAYLVALSRSLALSLANTGVQVMALCPGFTHTEFHSSDMMSEFKAATPSFLWYDADVVVSEGLAAIERGKSSYTSGRLYRWTMPLLRTALGRWLIAKAGVRRSGAT